MRCNYWGAADHERTYCPRSWQGSANIMRARSGAAPVRSPVQLADMVEALSPRERTELYVELRDRGILS